MESILVNLNHDFSNLRRASLKKILSLAGILFPSLQIYVLLLMGLESYSVTFLVCVNSLIKMLKTIDAPSMGFS